MRNETPERWSTLHLSPTFVIFGEHLDGGRWLASCLDILSQLVHDARLHDGILPTQLLLDLVENHVPVAARRRCPGHFVNRRYVQNRSLSRRDQYCE